VTRKGIEVRHDDDRIIVDTLAMQQAGDDIQKAISQMYQELDELDSAAAPLIASWDGEAKEAYTMHQRRWRSAAADLTTNLESIRRALLDSADGYASTETSNANLFR
jgi:WXG100 family type VII secretion target